MSLYDNLPVYKATYDLTLTLFTLIRNFTKEYKYTIGEQIKKEAIEMVTNIYRANIAEHKSTYIQNALCAFCYAKYMNEKLPEDLFYV